MQNAAPQFSSDWDIVEDAIRPSQLRISTAGSVDDGKSTLIGRLLHDTGNVYDDHLEALKKRSEKENSSVLSLALLTDGLKAEREQGITIDVAYRYFSTKKRRFILADSPGHEQYTRNMATAASTADLTIILADAQKGVLTQTRRHAFIAALLGVPRLLIAVNKMDLVGYSQQVFDRIVSEFSEFAAKIGVRELRFIPISALEGDNVVEVSRNMPWYSGETVMDYLENVYIGGDVNQVDFRFPVQYVIRPHQNYRGFAGQILSGHIKVGDEITTLPSLKRSRIKTIDVDSRDPTKRSLQNANALMSVVLTLEDEIDISRGDMLVRSHNIPQSRTDFEAMVVWMDETPFDHKKTYIIKHTTRETKALVREVKYRVDVNTLSKRDGTKLELNEVARVQFSSMKPMFVDAYRNNRLTGGFILIDPLTFRTAAACMVIDRLPSDLSNQTEAWERGPRSANIHKEGGFVQRFEREAKQGNTAFTVWCTGLSGSGKSSIATALERELFNQGIAICRLDGDNLRHGLNRDLGFATHDRSENIRRTAEVARLFNEAGVSVICSLISPLRSDREAARKVIGEKSFIEVFINAPLEVCERRDPRQLYRKARAGEIAEFTGISAPYEAPEAPDLRIDTDQKSLDDCVSELLKFFISKSKRL